VAEAAAAALAQIADRPSLDALCGRARQGHGLVKHASTRNTPVRAQFAARGDKATAARVYRQLIVPQEPQMVRIVALADWHAPRHGSHTGAGGRVKSKGRGKAQAAANPLPEEFPAPKWTAAMVKEYPKLLPPGQVERA